MSMPDITVVNAGPFFLFQPGTDAGTEWLGEHCPEDDEHTYWCGGLAVEPRYAVDLAQAMTDDGLTVN